MFDGGKRGSGNPYLKEMAVLVADGITRFGFVAMLLPVTSALLGPSAPAGWTSARAFIGCVSSSFCLFGTKCSSRVGELQGPLAGAVGSQAGAVVLRKETALWDS